MASEEVFNHSRTTYVALLVPTLETETRTFRLDMTDTAARVALLRRDSAGRRAGRRFVARLAAVVAQPLVGRTVLGDVPH